MVKDAFGSEFDGILFYTTNNGVVIPNLFVHGSSKRKKSDFLLDVLEKTHRLKIAQVDLIQATELVKYLCEHAEEVKRGGYTVSLSSSNHVGGKLFEMKVSEMIYTAYIEDILRGMDFKLI